MVVDVLGCCAAGLCARFMLTQHPAPQQAIADGERPVIADVASTDIGDGIRHTDQPVSPQSTHLQVHPGCATCCSKDAKDVREEGAEEDATSTFGSLSPGRHGDTGSADSEGAWTVGASPETTFRSTETPFAPATVSEQVEIDADVAAGHPDEKPPCQRQPVACGSVKLVSSSTSSVSEQPGVPAAAETAAAAATAEPRDADAAAGQAAITHAALEETAEQAALELASAEAAAEEAAAELAAAEAAAASAAAEAAAELAAAQAAAAQSEPVSARIVGRSGKFYTIEMDAGDQRAGDFAPSLSLTKRFREFAALDMELRPRHPALPKLPQKSVFFRKNFKCGFMDDREQQLGTYLSALVADPSAVAEPTVRRFLGLTC